MTSKDFKVNNSIIVDDVLIDVSAAADSGGLVYSSSSSSFVSSKGNIPIGVVRMWASGATSASPPDDYLICDGRQDLSQTTYADLYAVIGDRFTTSPNGSTFGLPFFNSSTRTYPIVIGTDSANHNSPYNQTANESTVSTGSAVNLSHNHTTGAGFGISSVTSSTLSHAHNANDSNWSHGHDYTANSTQNSTSHSHNLGNASVNHDHNVLQGNAQPANTGGPSGNHNHNTSGSVGNHSHGSNAANHSHNSSGPTGQNANSHSHSFTSNLDASSPSHAHTVDTSGFYFIIRYR